MKAERIGRWWDKDIEIDVLAIGEREILYGECKYQDSKVGPEVLMDLKNKAKKVVLDRKGKEEIFTLFSRSGFTKELRKIAQKESGVLLFTIEDLI